MISIQEHEFDISAEHNRLNENNHSSGAIVTFTGLVRDSNLGRDVIELEIEHYPEMAKNCLYNICQHARENWQLHNINVIHRYGKLHCNDLIVFVGVSSVHRQDAFLAAQFIMDTLKTNAPFWKKETIRTENSIHSLWLTSS
jgi:molybdopterin synthase catalytic subunit